MLETIADINSMTEEVDATEVRRKRMYSFLDTDTVYSQVSWTSALPMERVS